MAFRVEFDGAGIVGVYSCIGMALDILLFCIGFENAEIVEAYRGIGMCMVEIVELYSAIGVDIISSGVGIFFFLGILLLIFTSPTFSTNISFSGPDGNVASTLLAIRVLGCCLPC